VQLAFDFLESSSLGKLREQEGWFEVMRDGDCLGCLMVASELPPPSVRSAHSSLQEELHREGLLAELRLLKMHSEGGMDLVFSRLIDFLSGKIDSWEGEGFSAGVYKRLLLSIVDALPRDSPALHLRCFCSELRKGRLSATPLAKPK